VAKAVDRLDGRRVCGGGDCGGVRVDWGMRQVQPMLRRKVVETLAARFHSPVELDRLSLSMSRV